MKILALMAAYRSAEAAQILEQPELWEEPRANDHFSLFRIAVLVDQGRLKEALSSVSALESPSSGSWAILHAQMLRVLLLHQMGESIQPELSRASREVRHAQQSMLSSGGSPAPQMALLGKLAARASHLEEAEQLLSAIESVVAQVEIPIHSAYEEILRGEVLAARGLHEEAILRFRTSLDWVETAQAHESLARSLEAVGDLSAAIDHYAWISERRGMVLAECPITCSTSEYNLLLWHESHYRLARLHQRTGEDALATRFYQQYLEGWGDADTGVGHLRAAQREFAMLASTQRRPRRPRIESLYGLLAPSCLRRAFAPSRPAAGT